MRNYMSRTDRRSSGGIAARGFTLIELLLVLVILGLLATIVVPRFVGQSKDAKIKVAITQIDSFKTALNTYEVKCGGFPTTEEGLRGLIEQPSSAKEWSGPYLDSSNVPNDPWGKPYHYTCPGQNNSNGYDISSDGPDGLPGTGDDIDNWSNK
jgi:general secretion pathway protein G